MARKSPSGRGFAALVSRSEAHPAHDHRQTSLLPERGWGPPIQTRMTGAPAGRSSGVDDLEQRMAIGARLGHSFANVDIGPPAFSEPNFSVAPVQRQQVIQMVAPIVAILVKMGANGAADALMQATMNYYFGNASSVEEAFDDINGWQVARSTLEGAIPWKTPGGKLGRAAATAVGDVMVNMISNDDYTSHQALQDFAVGFIGDLAGGGMGELITKYGAKGVAKGLKKMGFGADKIEGLTGALPKGMKTKMQRLKIYTDRLKKAPPAKSQQGALDLINDTLDEVEDAFSGVKKVADPGLEYTGRMYPIQPDNVKKLKNGIWRCRTKGNRILIEPDGAFRIESLDGKVLLQKPGAG